MTETWDASLGQNVATVETSDARYTIWMEDEQSMEEKLKVIQSADLAGVAEWKLGFECADVWSLISNILKQTVDEESGKDKGNDKSPGTKEEYTCQKTITKNYLKQR